MSLMFAKQFSEAGQSSSQGRKGGRGKGSGMMSKSKGRKGREDEPGGENGSSGGIFDNGPYRTHMLFPGRKDEEMGAGGDPRRSSGSPGFMKGLMSWGKRPSDPKAGSQQEMSGAASVAGGGRGLRATPTRTESECLLDPYNNHYDHYLTNNRNNKSVSFHDARMREAIRLHHPSANYYNNTNHTNLCTVTRSLTMPPANHAINLHAAGTAGGGGVGENGHDYSYCSYSNRETVYSIYGKRCMDVFCFLACYVFIIIFH